MRQNTNISWYVSMSKNSTGKNEYAMDMPQPQTTYKYLWHYDEQTQNTDSLMMAKIQFTVTVTQPVISSSANDCKTRRYELHVRIQKGGGAGGRTPTPLKYHKNIGFLSNTGPDPLKNNKATKPAFNVVPPSARQRNAI